MTLEGDFKKVNLYMPDNLDEIIDKNDLKFLGIRICNCDLSDTYKIREFQHFYALILYFTFFNPHDTPSP